MEWALLMADPEKRADAKDAEMTERDKAAVLLMEWMRKHVTTGG